MARSQSAERSEAARAGGVSSAGLSWRCTGQREKPVEPLPDGPATQYCTTFKGDDQMMRPREIHDLVKDAVECSVYIRPKAPGLSLSELIEVGKQVGYEEGELRDGIQYAIQANDIVQNGSRLEPGERTNPLWDQLQYRTDPDFRNIEAFDHVQKELRDVARKLGAGRASIERTVLVERGAARGLSSNDIEIAIRVFVYAKHLIEKGDVLSFAPGRENRTLPSEQLTASRNAGVAPRPRPRLQSVHSHVRDVIERRTDGRSHAVQSLDAFAERLSALGYGVFRSWWIQTVSELGRLDVALNPVAASVLSAALVEGALTFVAKFAHGLGSGVMGSKTFDEAPPKWKIDGLVSGASSGGNSAILDAGSRNRADALIKVRQRIHAGRMLVDHPKGVPDLRPEEARDAKQTAELVVRRVIDWLDRNPPPSSATQT